MICTNCSKEKEHFPELFSKAFPGWCMQCVHDEVEYLYKKMLDERAVKSIQTERLKELKNYLKKFKDL